MTAELAIGLVDDDADQRATIKKNIVARLKGTGLRVVDSPPFANLDSYLTWIREENIGTLVIDWRLNERGMDAEPVTYEGKSVVSTVHAQLPFFPIFVITAYSESEDVKAEGGSVEQVVNRGEFRNLADQLTERFRRAAGRFSADQERKLARMSKLAKEVALGTGGEAQMNELRALQAELQLACEPAEVLTDGALLSEADTVQQEAKELARRIEELLGEEA